MSKKEKILAAATELFARHGFSETATSEIAKSAGVAQGTVFHHFKSKDNLLISICDKLVSDYVQGIIAASQEAETGWEALENVIRYALSFLKTREEAISVAFQVTRVLNRETQKLHHDHFHKLMSRVIEVIRGCLERGQKDGSIRPVEPGKTAFLIHVLITGIHHTEMDSIIKLPPDLTDEIVGFCRRSLATADILSEGQIDLSGGLQHG